MALTIPELPEVESIVKEIKEIEGCKVVFNKVLDKIDSIRKTPIYNIAGMVIDKVERKGKYIIIKFEKSAFLIHLGMSGKLILDEGSAPVPNHTHWLIHLDNGWQLRYIDHRHFGNLWHMSYKDCVNYAEARLGPEPSEIDPKSFILRIRQGKYLDKYIKSVLLDQKLIAGLGNIYASEACYEAFIHPKIKVKDLTDKQIEHLLYASRKVLSKAIKNNGTTFRDYRDAKNRTGNNQNFLGVYKQIMCKRCGDKIQKETVDNRSTYWCGTCQKIKGDIVHD